MTDSTETTQGDIQAAIEAGRAQTTHIELREGLVVVTHPDDVTATVHDLAPYEDTPRRASGNVTLQAVADFLAYVRRHETEHTVVFHDTSGHMRAVLNHHATADPGWRDFTAYLDRETTPAYRAWMRAAQAALSQVDFANFLEERLGEIAEPDGAGLLDAAEHFRAHTIISFRSQNKLANGQRQLEYVEQVEGGESTGKVTMPERLRVVLQPYHDSERITVDVRLRWRVVDRAVRFALLFDDTLTDALEVIHQEAVDQAKAMLKAPVLRGKDL